MVGDPKLLEVVALACLERDPVDLRCVNEDEVRRIRAAIKRATAEEGAILRRYVTRKHFLCGCLDFTEQAAEEHLIVGYGYRYGNTTRIERIHHVLGEQRRVAIPDYIRIEIRRHHFHRSNAEVIVFHNHPRTGYEPEWFYTLKSLLSDLPIPSTDDRRQLQQYILNPVGVLRELFDQGRVLFYLGESGFVKEVKLPPLLRFWQQLTS